MKQLRLPSPAMVVALVALFAALAGTGYAATQLAPNSVGSAQLKGGAVTKAKLSAAVRADMSGGGYGARANASVLATSEIAGFAHVETNDFVRPAVIEASRNATSVERVNVGIYRVLFNRPVNVGCVGLASIAPSVDHGAHAHISVAPSSNPNAQLISVRDGNGATSDYLDFTVAVIC